MALFQLPEGMHSCQLGVKLPLRPPSYRLLTSQNPVDQAEGSWILRYQCKHRHTDHDPVTNACSNSSCNCDMFHVSWSATAITHAAITHRWWSTRKCQLLRVCLPAQDCLTTLFSQSCCMLRQAWPSTDRTSSTGAMLHSFMMMHHMTLHTHGCLAS